MEFQVAGTVSWNEPVSAFRFLLALHVSELLEGRSQPKKKRRLGFPCEAARLTTALFGFALHKRHTQSPISLLRSGDSGLYPSADVSAANPDECALSLTG